MKISTQTELITHIVFLLSIPRYLFPVSTNEFNFAQLLKSFLSPLTFPFSPFPYFQDREEMTTKIAV